MVFVNQAGEEKRGADALRSELAPSAAKRASFDFSIKKDHSNWRDRADAHLVEHFRAGANVAIRDRGGATSAGWYVAVADWRPVHRRQAAIEQSR